MNKYPKVKILKGGKGKDKKGVINFVNDFNFAGIKRFYFIELPKKNMIRAYHGHLKESKSVFVTSGSLLLCIVKISNPNSPKKTVKVRRVLLDSVTPKVCKIPKGYANGIMSLKKNTSVIFFSNKTLKESKKDDYRYDKNYWGKNVWEREGKRVY